MKVSPQEPFQIIYSLYAHEYLGDLFESFVVQKNENGKLTYKHQNISSLNAKEFASGLDDKDYKIIKLMDNIQQDVVYKKFNTKKIKQPEFFLKVYDKEKGDELVQKTIADYLDRVKVEILPLLVGKEVYIMGNDGEPAWKKIDVCEEPASILFHFMRNEENTHYFPTIKHQGEKVHFQYNNSQLISQHPAWLLVGEDKILQFEKDMDGNKIKPFLNKKFIVVPKKIEESYYSKFVSQIVSNYDVYAKGFKIVDETPEPKPIISFKELEEVQSDLFANGSKKGEEEDGKIVFELAYDYGEYKFSADSSAGNSVKMEKTEDSYVFHKIKRKTDWEKGQLLKLSELGLDIRHGRASVNKSKAFSWISENKVNLQMEGYIFKQSSNGQKTYFLGKSSINIEIKENNDWFDIYAVVKFGDYEIPFLKLRNLILNKKNEFELPNGEIAVIPEEWLVKYNELFAFSEEHDEEGLKLQKHHLALVHELQEDKANKVSLNKKLEKLRDFENIDDYPLPKGFNGELRNYQKAGYNWMRFLNDYNFGGCLADDMGLGKTVQTLALLQSEKEKETGNTSLLIMPTSLVYNWEHEAKKFTPDLKIHVYTGTYRDKDITKFSDYDVVITSYGIARIDVDLLAAFYFDYVILDESQAIKNPNSNIAQAVKELKSKHKLILTGTPIENSTLDLWSQMSFINSGLLGTQSFFKKTFLKQIEKLKDEKKTQKLYSIIKPFILRRKKDQVLTELPPKIEQMMFCSMTTEQEKVYEETKSYYRNKILGEIDEHGMGKSQFTLLQGLTKLRQIANHPFMVDEEYDKGSGKMDDVIRTLEGALAEHHKVLVFSQFVKHLSLFKKTLDERKIKYNYLDGSTKNRQEQVEQFQSDDETRVFLISLKAGGLGLNLTKADYVFILDPWWNPAIEAQAVDRAHRMGQKNVVHTYKFITKNSVEEKIVRLQNSKMKLANDLITTEDSFVKNLSKDDISELLG